MKIIIVNDDSIYAKGLNTLVNTLCEAHEIYVFAPKYQQSAKSHALTMNDIIPVHEEHVFDHPNVKEQWAIAGTPADCVKIGIEKFKDLSFDLLISGINHGPNLGVDTIYSGTVAAALEGSFHNIPSIALSLIHENQEGFQKASEFVKNNLELLMSHKWDQNILNINFPETTDYKGVLYTTLGHIIYDNPVEKRLSPRGAEYYWIAGDLRIPEDQNNTDVKATMSGYVSISPLKFSFEDPNKIEMTPEKFKL